MMRKIIVFFAVLAALSSLSAATLYLAPMQGSFGVNLASSKYRADLGKDNPTGPGFADLLSNVKDGEYCDESMIAGCSMENASGGDVVKVTVSCPYGFNFVSQSNSAFVRPFAIAFIIHSGSMHMGASGATYIGTEIISGSTTNAFEKTIPDGDRAIWFDVVLVLPGELAEDGRSINIGGKLYPLANGDDYVSTLNITIETEAATGDGPKTITTSIPFSGFFNSNDVAAEKNREAAMNISIHPTAAASNLDIKGLSASQEAKKVADIEMYYFVGNETENITPILSKPPRMFLSASNDPFLPNDEGFELLHTSVGYDTPHTSYNSIGYSVSTRSYTKEEAEKSFSIFEGGVDNSPKSVNLVFTGDSYTNTDGTEYHGSSGGFIYPRQYEAVAFGNNDTRYTYHYFYWNDGIYVTLDPMSSDIMYSGIYRDTIYFHVIYE